MKLSKKIILFAFTILTTFIFTQLNAKAQIYFGITPIRIEHKIGKGKSLTDAIWVRNNGSSPLRLKVYVENWYLQYDGTPIFVGSNSVPYSCKNWIKVNPQNFRLMPNEIKLVRYTITVPENSSEGGYHGAISFENVPFDETERKTSAMFFTGKIAAIIYVKIGDIEPIGKIFDLKISENNNSTEFIILIKNDGKTHFRTKGNIEIKNKESQKIYNVNVPNVVVLPESEREIKCRFNEKLPKGKYRAFCKLDIGREELIGFIKEFTIEK